MNLNATEENKRRTITVTGPRHSADLLPQAEISIEDGKITRLKYTYGRPPNRREVIFTTINPQDLEEMEAFLEGINKNLQRWVNDTRPSMSCELLR